MARLDAELQQAEVLSLSDYEVLVELSEAPQGSMRMAELAERMLLSPSGLTRRLVGLVRVGLVGRRACPSDRRGSLAVLTPEGLGRLERAAPTHVDGVRAYVIDRLDREELRALACALRRVTDALDAAPGPPEDRNDYRSDVPVTTGRPCAIQPLVPPATDTAR